MTKKNDIERAEELANSLFPGDADATPAQVSELLDDLGCDRAELRSRARAAAEALFRKSVAEGKTPPPFLKRAMDSLGDADHFPTDASAAALVADRVIQSLGQQTATRRPARVLEAARQPGSTGPTAGDEGVKEKLRAELRRRLGDEAADE